MKNNRTTSIFLAIIPGLFAALQAACQNPNAFVLEGRIKGLEESKVVFNRLQGHKEFKIKELLTLDDGSFTINLDSVPQTGQYRLRIDPGKRNGVLDFLVTGKNIRFATHADHLTDSIQFENSEINEAWYSYFRMKENFEGRLSILEHLLGIYPEDERFYPEIVKEFNLLQDERDVEVSRIAASHPNSILSKYIISDQLPRMNPYLSTKERQELFRKNYLKHLDFTDTLLLRTDIFPGKVLSYIMLYRNSNMDRDQQALEFIKATDNLLPMAMVQPLVYNYMLGYTISGFEQIGLEQVLTHIADNYPVDETCVSNQESGELQRRMEGYRKLAPGNQAPDIIARDINDVPFQLSSVEAEYTLVVFWASWCPHCTAMLPEIKKLALQINAGEGKPLKLKVVSISIDHAEKDYSDFLIKNAMDEIQIKNFWVNICDYKAWEGKIANDYYLYATPTMILLGKNLKIAGKPSNIQELVKQLGFEALKR